MNGRDWPTQVKETNALAEQQKVEDSAPDVRLKKKKARLAEIGLLCEVAQ